jgi:pimeloyl-ACP methyl ester carboxylesterase
MDPKIRDLGFMAWTNDLAHLEAQKGSLWKKTVQNENTRFKDALKPLGPIIKEFKKSLKSTRVSKWVWKGWEIHGTPFSPEEEWLFKETGFKCKVWDADVYDTYFAAAVQDSDGFERFSVKVFQIKDSKPVATLQTTGPQVAWLHGDSLLVYLGSSQDLRYDTVCLWDPKTDQSRTLYNLEDATENLELGRAEDGSVYVIANDFVKKRLGFVSHSGIKWSDRSAEIYVVSRKIWFCDGHYKSFKDTFVEAISLKSKWAITCSYGIRTLWKLSDEPVQMIVIWGQIKCDTRDPSQLHVTDMRYEPYVVKTEDNEWKLSTPDSYEFPCSYYNDVAPAFVVHPTTPIKKGLLVTAYGAYGSPTRIGNLIPRWRPLLENGWTIASVCVPGSGDHDIAWKKAGQRRGRGEAIRVFTETIRRLQDELGIRPSATALYGRSAGGLLVISAASLTPGLVGALYVESPYVDVLRTISNPELPLTLLETKEFGIGSNPTNILATGAWSPMEYIPADGIPELFVVARSDMADLEVYPYEVVKWILRMRGNSGNNKLLYVDSGKGHFTTDYESRAEDLALLDQWLKETQNGTSPDALRRKNRSYKYNTMANGMSRKNRKNMTRKNRKDRKDRKNRNNVTMGGKRRSGRKSRGSRKH